MTTKTIDNGMKRLSIEEKAAAISEYRSGKTLNEVGNSFGVSGTAIMQLLKKKGIPRRTIAEVKRKYSLNESFFDTINTEERAYFLGLVYADGCHVPERNALRIVLIEQDENILNQFRNSLATDKPLFTVKKKVGWQTQRGIEICSENISRALSSHGVTERKSLTLKFPNSVPTHLMNHFLRGYFDGDGCISFSQLESGVLQGYVAFECSKEFAEDLSSFIQGELGMNGHLRTRKGSSWAVSYSGNRQVRTLMEWLYKGSSVWLRRKRDKYDKFCEVYNAKLTEESALSSGRWGR